MSDFSSHQPFSSGLGSGSGYEGMHVQSTERGICLQCAQDKRQLANVCQMPLYRLSQRVLLLVLGVELFKFLKTITTTTVQNELEMTVDKVPLGVIHCLLLTIYLALIFSFKCRYGGAIFLVFTLVQLGLFITHMILHRRRRVVVVVESPFVIGYFALTASLSLISVVLASIHFVRLKRLTRRYFTLVEKCLSCMVKSNMSTRNPMRRLAWILLGINLTLLMHDSCMIWELHQREQRLDRICLILPFLHLLGLIVIALLMMTFLKLSYYTVLAIALSFALVNVGGNVAIHVLNPPINPNQLSALLVSWLFLWVLYTGPYLFFQMKRERLLVRRSAATFSITLPVSSSKSNHFTSSNAPPISSIL